MLYVNFTKSVAYVKEEKERRKRRRERERREGKDSYL